MAGAVEHPDQGKIIDMADDMKKNNPNVPDPSCILYPTKGYGDINVLRAVLKREKPDAIFLITDPRYFEWLFHAENGNKN